VTARRPGRSRWPLQPLSAQSWTRQRPTYAEARPAIIEAAVKRAQARPSGNWYVLGASRAVRPGRPHGVTVAGTELVAWRDSAGKLVVGPGACPHLGAPLSAAAVDCGALVCRWHGLRIGGRGSVGGQGSVGGRGGAGWRPLPAYDDGVLAWVRLDAAGGEPPTDAPVLSARPPLSHSVQAVANLTGVCEPEDVVANRLDPWHGAWFHPYFFSRLAVLSAPAEVAVADEDDRFDVSVTFRVSPGLGAPVRAEFSCPEPRTVVMRITDGEGTGSVVETHATPLGRGPDGRPRTAVTEAVVAHSPRPGFALARAAAPALRPVISRAAGRLWRDDLAYAERRYWLRAG
jgi:phenylpropionate dioxygenase-like ring-hydroxylating dioxygenase large terminal subunit